MTESDIHIQERITEIEETRRDDEQNHQLYLRHRQFVKYYLYSKNENSFIKFVLSFVSLFSIFKHNTQFKI